MIEPLTLFRDALIYGALLGLLLLLFPGRG
jgi:hypothetical protein